MNAVTQILPAAAGAAQNRVGEYDWAAIATELNGHGCAVLAKLLSARLCAEIAALYPHEQHFRSHIHMARHGFGRGEYRYFKYPLPAEIGELRTALYPHLAAIANGWNERMAIATRYPKRHAEFLKTVTRPGSYGRRRYCCNTGRATSIVCIRTSTASSPSRCKSPCCCPSPKRISPAANSS